MQLRLLQHITFWNRFLESILPTVQRFLAFLSPFLVYFWDYAVF